MPSRARGRFNATWHGQVPYGVARPPVKAVVMFAVVVLAGLTGFGGAQWTDATFSNTKTVTGNVLATGGLSAPTALVVTVNAGALVLTWGITSSTYADGYKVYRAAASGGPYTNVATVAGRTTATWTDTTPPDGVNYYKLAAYRYNWLSAETSISSGTAATRYYSTTDVVVPAGANTVHIRLAGGSDLAYGDAGGVLNGDMAVAPGDVLHLTIGTQEDELGGDATLRRNALAQAAWAQGGYGDWDTSYEGTTSHDPLQVTNLTYETNQGPPYIRLTYLP